MRWWRKSLPCDDKDEQADRSKASQVAAEKAEQTLLEALSSIHESESIKSALARIREQNHFREAIEEALGK